MQFAKNAQVFFIPGAFHQQFIRDVVHHLRHAGSDDMQWPEFQAILDDAGVPNSVLPEPWRLHHIDLGDDFVTGAKRLICVATALPEWKTTPVAPMARRSSRSASP